MQIMNRSFALPGATLLVTTLLLSFPPGTASPQEVGLVTLNVKEVAKGVRANALRLKPVVNDKGESIGRIDDFIFSKDGEIFVVVAVGDVVGLDNHLVAVPFRNLKLDDPSTPVLPGASPAALQKLPVFLYNR
jgi:sporulation protein YlmC with PRC-barrel domain